MNNPSHDKQIKGKRLLNGYLSTNVYTIEAKQGKKQYKASITITLNTN